MRVGALEFSNELSVSSFATGCQNIVTQGRFGKAIARIFCHLNSCNGHMTVMGLVL